MFIQRKNKLSDLKIISHLTKSYSSVYIILVGVPLSIEEKKEYLTAGTDSIISEKENDTELIRILISPLNTMRGSIAHLYVQKNWNPSRCHYGKNVRYCMLISNYNPIALLILTWLAIRLESKGDAVYRSKELAATIKYLIFINSGRCTLRC